MKTIQQKVLFKNCTTGELYKMFLDSKSHSKLAGSPAHISAKKGVKFSAWDGYCFGENLQLIKNRLIVQSWRSADWNKDDTDSTFILTFEQKGNDAEVSMVHANVPDREAKGLATGWTDFYWKPWKEYLATLKKKK